MYNLALAYRDVGKPDRALPLFRAAAAGVENGQFVHQHADQILRNFAGCLEYFRHWDQAEAWRRKLLTVVKTRRGAGSPWYASDMVPLGANLLAQKRFADAEPVLRECLASRERTAPAGWSTAYTRSLLGAALSGQQKYAEAESLLLSGYQGLKPSEAQPRDQVRLVPLRQALQRLIQNYDDWGKPDEAARWREKLAHLELRRSE